MNVLVTGAGGFIAGWVAAAFADAGANVSGIDREPGAAARHPAAPRFSSLFAADLAGAGTYEDWMEALAPDLVVHLAGPASVEASFEDPAGDLRAHLEPLLSLYGCLRRINARPRVLLASSAAVYGEPVELPISEAAPLQPLSPYGYHKIQQELLVEEFARLHGIPGCRARIFSVFGEGLRHLAFWDITRRAMHGDGRIHGTGEETRDYLHAADVARALVVVSEHLPFGGEAVNVASGVETRIAELARMIHGECGVESVVLEDSASERGKPTRWRANVEKLQRAGFVPKVSLASGIERTVGWIREQG